MIFRFILAILATYRLTQLVVFDDGPLFVFTRLREWSDREARIKQDEILAVHRLTREEFNQLSPIKANEISKQWRGVSQSITDGLHCPYCVGIWAAALCTILVTFPTKLGDIFLTCLAIAGGQAILERNGK